LALLALLNLEEMMENRGVEVGYSNIYRWGKIRAKFGGILSERQKRPVGKSRRMNETYIKSPKASGNIAIVLLTRTARPSTYAHHTSRQEGSPALF
jgi:hypothetical protein